MSKKCQQCPPAQDCLFPSDLEIYGLQGPNGPWSWLMNGALYYGNGPGGGWRGGGGGVPAGGGVINSTPSNTPGVPYNPPDIAYSKAQTACNSCTSLAQFCYIAKPGLFNKSGSIASFASSQSQADAAALAYAQSKVAGFGAASCIKNPATDALRAIWLCLGENVGSVDSIFTAPGNLSGTGVAKCTWAIQGALPGGLNFKDNGNNTSELTGTANESGMFQFTVKALSSAGDTYSTVKVTVSVLGFVTTSPLPAGNLCSNYDLQLQANGGIPPYGFAIDSSFPGSLPKDLDIVLGGRIMGKPTGMGTNNFALVVTDSVGQQCRKPFSLTINAPATMPSFTTGGGLPNGHSGNNYFQFIVVIAGCPPYTLTILSGSLPVSLHLGKTGTGDWAITGLPGSGDVGSYGFTIQAIDNAGQSITQPFALTIDTTTVVTGSCANNPLITASGNSPTIIPPGGSRPTAGIEMTHAAAINDLINNLVNDGCNCPPMSPIIDSFGHSTLIHNTSATCTIFVSQTGGYGGPFAIGPGASFNYATNYNGQIGNWPSGPIIFALGGGVNITITYDGS
jgi:hypothetical protein